MNTTIFLHIDLRVLLDQRRERRVARGLGDQQKAVELTTESFDRIGKQVEGLLGALSVINENVKSMEEGRIAVGNLGMNSVRE